MELLLICSVMASAIVTAIYLRGLMLDYGTHVLERRALCQAGLAYILDYPSGVRHEYLYREYKNWLMVNEIKPHLISYDTYLIMVIDNGRTYP